MSAASGPQRFASPWSADAKSPPSVAGERAKGARRFVVERRAPTTKAESNLHVLVRLGLKIKRRHRTWLLEPT